MMRPHQAPPQAKCVRRNGCPPGGSIFAHRYLSGDHLSLVPDLQRRAEQCKTPKGNIAPPQGQAGISGKGKAPGKENNPALANKGTSARHPPSAKHTTATSKHSESAAPRAKVSGFRATEFCTAVTSPMSQTQKGALAAALSSLHNLRPSVAASTKANRNAKKTNPVRGCNVSKADAKSKMSCYLAARTGKRTGADTSRCQHSARGSILGINESAVLERSRSGKERDKTIVAPAAAAQKRICTSRAGSKKPSVEEHKKSDADNWQGEKITQLKGRLKNITISLSKGSSRQSSAEGGERSGLREERCGVRQVLAVRKTGDLNRAQMQVTTTTTVVVAAATRSRANNGEVLEKLHALRQRIKSLFDVGSKCVMVVKKKMSDAAIEENHNK